MEKLYILKYKLNICNILNLNFGIFLYTIIVFIIYSTIVHIII